jgi:6-phosphogluconate dehydrogenase (decarboxylating)
MSHVETVYAVSDPHPSVEQAVGQLALRLDKQLKDLMIVFEREGKQLWSVEHASHTVTPVPVIARSAGHWKKEAAPAMSFVASAVTLVSFQRSLG